MKHIDKIKPKQILIAIFGALPLLLVACNSGSVNPNLQSINKPQPASPSQIKSEDVAPQVELAWGYNPTTNTLIPITGMNPTKFVADGGSQVKTEVSQYKEYSKYTSDYSDKASSSQFSIKGGVGINYGVYSGSIKAAYQEAASGASGQLTLTKTIGMMGGQEQQFTLDSAQLADGSINIENVRTAIEAGAPPSFESALEKVRKATSERARLASTLDFYKKFGTHYISSVTKGYVGGIMINLTQKTAKGDSSQGGSAAVNFSSPNVSASLETSAQRSDAFNKNQWSATVDTFSLPNDPAIRTALGTIKTSVDDELKDVVKTNVAAVINPAILPDISQMTLPAPNAASIQKADELKILLENRTADLNTLKQKTASLKNTFSTGQSATDETVSKGYFANIAREISSSTTGSKTLADILNKFDSGGVYVADTRLNNPSNKLSVEATYTITEAREFLNQMQFLPNLVQGTLSIEQAKKLAIQAEQDLAAQQATDAQAKEAALAEEKQANDVIKAAEVRQTAMNKFNTDFTTWLKGSIYEAEVSLDDRAITTYEIWLRKIPTDQLVKYGMEYKKFLQTNNLISSDDSNVMNNAALKSINTANDLNSKQTKLLAFQEVTKDDTEVSAKPSAILNFSIMPWAAIFPELNSSQEYILGPADVIRAKLLDKINRVLDLREYLLLCASKGKDSGLINLYTADGVDNKPSDELGYLIKLINELRTKSDTIKFNGSTYALDSEQDMANLDNAITNKINNLAMTKSTWYKITNELMDKGLISVSGVVVEIAQPNKSNVNYMTWDPQYYGQAFMPTTYDLGTVARDIPGTIDTSIGSVLEPSIRAQNGTKLSTAEILITSNATKDAKTNRIDNLKLLTSRSFQSSPASKYEQNYDGSVIEGLTLQFNKDMTPDKGGAYVGIIKNIRNGDNNRLQFANNGYMFNNLNPRSIDVSVKLTPLDNNAINNIATALGGSNKLSEQAPKIKSFYLGTGAAVSAALNNLLYFK